ncbi:hypothetical protein M422DRAFT_273553 [Sphaerobolus stellatus SS14]|uniref:Uncharacterized protein n=1 Tax=Sphaerobolus stellatus (strain SS14) TaxID=990650 RepID=A0A0C9UJB1_SPHS4|nr:hypothetical protein M422DRAFT_273553 [Sphaerobolus stellatus SS14]
MHRGWVGFMYYWCKRCAPTGLYKPKAPSKSKNAPKTSAKSITSKKCNNCTLLDWMSVFSYVDSHPGILQEKVIQYFRMRWEGVLESTQSTLSCKLKDQQTLQEHIDDNSIRLRQTEMAQLKQKTLHDFFEKTRSA